MSITVKEVLIVKNELTVSKKGTEYCTITYREKGGKQGALKVFNNYMAVYQALQEKKLYKIETDWEASFPNINQIVEGDGQIAQYVNYLFTSTEKAMKELDDLLSLITDEDFIELNNRIFTTTRRYEFIKAPAAIGHHHIECGGLLQHTKELMEFIYQLSQSGNYSMVDFQVALEGALLHDICKIDEYKYGLLDVTEMNPAYYLAGHLSMGAELVALHAQGLNENKIENVKHIIRSHHYKKEWGAVVEPVTLEAYLVYLADTWSTTMNKFMNCEFDKETGLGNVMRQAFVKLT